MIFLIMILIIIAIGLYKAGQWSEERKQHHGGLKL